DDAVEPEHLETPQPHLRDLRVAGGVRELEALHVLLEEGPSLDERAFMDLLAVPQEHVECDEPRGRLRREPLDARLRRMQPQLHEIELEAALLFDHDLAVER